MQLRSPRSFRSLVPRPAGSAGGRVWSCSEVFFHPYHIYRRGDLITLFAAAVLVLQSSAGAPAARKYHRVAVYSTPLICLDLHFVCSLKTKFS